MNYNQKQMYVQLCKICLTLGILGYSLISLASFSFELVQALSAQSGSGHPQQFGHAQPKAMSWARQPPAGSASPGSATDTAPLLLLVPLLLPPLVPSHWTHLLRVTVTGNRERQRPLDCPTFHATAGRHFSPLEDFISLPRGLISHVLPLFYVWGGSSFHEKVDVHNTTFNWSVEKIPKDHNL